MSRLHLGWWSRVNAKTISEHLEIYQAPRQLQLDNHAMLSTARSKGLERAIASARSASIPAFLLPAFPIAHSRAFSSTPLCASQIGRAPLSIPPEVKFEVLPAPLKKNGWANPLASRETVQIEGPLGMLALS